MKLGLGIGLSFGLRIQFLKKAFTELGAFHF